MDYKDYIVGATKDFFYHRAKIQLISILLNKLGKNNRFKILDLGAGCGDDLPVINQFGEVYAIDKDIRALELIPQFLVVDKKVCDATNIPYEDEFFDVIVAFDVLEHIENDKLVIKEIYRLLKPSGFFIFTVPAFSFLYSSHDKALNHVRRYNKREIKNLLSYFKRIKLGYWVFLLFGIVAIQRILTKRASKPRVHYMKLPRCVNNILYFLLKIENCFIKHNIPLPFGLTIFGIYQK